MPTLNWLLKTSGLKNIKLLTSPTSLNTPISSVNVLDNPDVLKWFQRDELILTTGFVFKEHPEMMATSIKALKEAGCCALGIKVPRYFRTVPEALRERSFLFFIAQYSYLQTGDTRAILVILGN